jgi:diketogulonate reductase-like aldo/keto reductase
LALCYENEDVIGRAFKEVFADGALKREDFFIVDKLWNTYHSKNEVSKCLDLQLKSLGFDYLDLYLMHWPFGFKVWLFSFLGFRMDICILFFKGTNWWFVPN